MPENRLTPVDILNLRFRRRLSGYAVSEVDPFLRQCADEIERLLEERAAGERRAEGLEKELERYRAMENTLRDALVLAQKTAEETRAAARAQADAIVQEARAHAAEIEARADAVRLERQRLARDLRAQLSAQLAWLDHELEPETPALRRESAA